MQPAEAEMTGNERLVQETFARFGAGRPLDGIVHPDYRAEGERWPIDPGGPGYRMEPRVISERAPGRVFVEAFWTHESGGRRGSAGLAWSVIQVSGGMLRSARYYPTRTEAERRADAG